MCRLRLQYGFFSGYSSETSGWYCKCLLLFVLMLLLLLLLFTFSQKQVGAFAHFCRPQGEFFFKDQAGSNMDQLRLLIRNALLGGG